MAPPVLAFGRSTGLPLALQTLRRACLVGRLPFDLLFVHVCSLESLSDCVSSSAGDRACFPFDFRALLLGSHEQGPLLSGGATALSVGHRKRSDL